MENSGSTIYKNAFDLEAALKRLEDDEAVEQANKALVRKFVATWLAKGYTKARGVKLIYCLRKLARILSKPFAEASKDDIIGLVGKLENEKLSDSTKHDMKVVLKTFFRWMKGDDEQFPKEVSWLKPKIKNRRHKLPEEILTEEEVIHISQTATNTRDKALILVLYETGCRIGELLSLRVKNVAFDEYGAVLRVTGKTGDRRVRIISSAPVLTAWLEHYNAKDDPEAFLWPPQSNYHNNPHTPMLHASVFKTIKVLARKAGIKKRVHPHLFRHSRATALANKLTEAQMKEFFGWTQASEMASVYVHLSGRDVDNALLALQGFAKPPQAQEETLKLTFCQRCKEKNSPTSKFCTRCGTPFNQDLLIRDSTQQDDQLIKRLMANPDFKEYLLEKVVSLGLHKTMEGDP